jgi:hypothetical protein
MLLYRKIDCNRALIDTRRPSSAAAAITQMQWVAAHTYSLLRKVQENGLVANEC